MYNCKYVGVYIYIYACKPMSIFTIEYRQLKMSGPPRELCPKCQKAVYANEAKLGAGKKWHSQCFKCSKTEYFYNLNYNNNYKDYYVNCTLRVIARKQNL